jgi:hypothetical protein
MRVLIAAVLAVGLVGCATRQISVRESAPVPSDRQFLFRDAQPDTGSLVVVRDRGMMGAGCPMDILVDGKSAAHLRVGESLELHVPAGARIVGVAPTGKGLCGLSNPDRHRRETTLDVSAGNAYRLRAGVSQDGEPYITPTAFD